MTEAPNPDLDTLAERFEAQRPQLRAVAYRMLGSMPEAEDVVQTAWLRISRTDTGSDRQPRRLPDDGRRKTLPRCPPRPRRPSRGVDRAAIPDPVVSAADGTDPEQEALLADSVGLAMLIVLDTLSPPERLAFVLHDTFGLPFEQIAPIVDRTPTATRQLASRARRRVRGAHASADVPMTRQRELVDAFIAASRAGDFGALVRVLDPNVVLRGDLGTRGGALARTAEVRGGRDGRSAGPALPGLRRGRSASDREWLWPAWSCSVGIGPTP